MLVQGSLAGTEVYVLSGMNYTLSWTETSDLTATAHNVQVTTRINSLENGRTEFGRVLAASPHETRVPVENFRALNREISGTTPGEKEDCIYQRVFSSDTQARHFIFGGLPGSSNQSSTLKLRATVEPSVECGEQVLTSMSWGVSMKTKGKKGQEITRRVSNARDDKVWTSYLWRYLIPEQRVLIPVNGFYEWKRENKKLVAAYHITPAAGPAMFFAGIYKKPKDEVSSSEFSIVTTAANKAMSAVHDRMPVTGL